MSNSIAVDVVESVDASLMDAMARLIPLLSATASVPTAEDMSAILQQNCARLLVARDGNGGGRIIGTLTLIVFRIPTGAHAWIEDVVVEEETRGAGVGEALTREALRLAAADGVDAVDLTSRPSRQSANRLYQRVGFERRDTNVYRYAVKPT